MLSLEPTDRKILWKLKFVVHDHVLQVRCKVIGLSLYNPLDEHVETPLY